MKNNKTTEEIAANIRSAEIWAMVTKGKKLPISREQEARNRRRGEYKNQLQREDELINSKHF